MDGTNIGSTDQRRSNSWSCSCYFDKNYLFGRHGLLDLTKIIFGLIAWISMIVVPYDSGVLDFLFTMILTCWISTIIWLTLLGFCFQCMNNCCAVKWINWYSILFWWNGILGLLFIAADICGIVGVLPYNGTTSHTGLSVAVSFAVFTTIVYFVDAYFYKNQNAGRGGSSSRKPDEVAI